MTKEIQRVIILAIFSEKFMSDEKNICIELFNDRFHVNM